MKYVSIINFDASSELLKDKSFHNEKLLEIKHVLGTTRHTRIIQNDHYKKIYRRKVLSERDHLIEYDQAMLWDLLGKYEFIFNKILCTWKTESVLSPDTVFQVHNILLK